MATNENPHPLVKPGVRGAIYRKVAEFGGQRVYKVSSPPAGNAVAEEQRPQVAQSHNENMRVATEDPLHEQIPDNEGDGILIEVDPELPESPKPKSKEGEREHRRRRVHTVRTSELSYPSTRTNTKLTDLTTQYKELNLRLLEADATIRDQETQINGLTETITRLHLREGELAKDDSYFSTQFSDIANSITQWALTHFPRDSLVPIHGLDQLPQGLRQSILHAVPRGEDLDLLSKRESRIRVISSVVLENLYRELFRTLPGATDAGNALLVIGPQLQGTAFQIQRWRSLTHNLLTKGTGYERNFDSDVFTLTQALGQLISVLAPAGLDPGQRNDELYKLVECAAKVSVEARKQLDIISFDPPRPGMPFNAEIMDDLSCTYEIDELMDGGATVQIALCPTIWRQSCDSGGSLSSKPSLVMKSKVWTVMADDD